MFAIKSATELLFVLLDAYYQRFYSEVSFQEFLILGWVGSKLSYQSLCYFGAGRILFYLLIKDIYIYIQQVKYLIQKTSPPQKTNKTTKKQKQNKTLEMDHREEKEVNIETWLRMATLTWQNDGIMFRCFFILENSWFSNLLCSG